MALVLIAITIVNFITVFIFELFGKKAGSDDFSLLPLLYSGLGGFGMVMVAQMLAPSHKKTAAVFFGIIAMLVGGYGIYIGEGFIGRLVDVAITVGAGIATYMAYQGNELTLPN